MKHEKHDDAWWKAKQEENDRLIANEREKWSPEGKADYEEMERQAREEAKVYNQAREMIRQATGEVWVLQCCVCKQFFDYDTREEIEEPPENALISHMYCDSCFNDALTALIVKPGPKAIPSCMKRKAN